METSFTVEISALAKQVQGRSPWAERLAAALTPEPEVALHVAIFHEPFLSLALEGRKTVESRFSQHRVAPFQSVHTGDVILMKTQGGPVRGLAVAERVWSFDLSVASIERLRERFSEDMCVDDAFWFGKKRARFATLIRVAEPLRIAPVQCVKKDRRGWVVMRSRQLQLSLF